MIFIFSRHSFRCVTWRKLHLDRNTVCIFLVMNLVKLIYRVKCMKEERYAHSTVQYKPSVAATIDSSFSAWPWWKCEKFVLYCRCSYHSFAYISSHSKTYFFKQAWQVARIRYIAKVCFEVRKKDLGERERCFASADTKEVQVFVGITTKYVIKYTYILSLRKGYWSRNVTWLALSR